MSDNQTQKNIEKAFKYPCPSCGGKLEYSAEKQKIACEYCGFSEDYSRNTSMVVEKPLESAVSEAPKHQAQDIGKKAFSCDNCGSKFMVEADKLKVSCGFCGSTEVNVEAYDLRYIKPSGIIPFSIGIEDAQKQFKKWLRQGWFHPRSLRKLAVLDDLHGIYIPFWTYDAQTDSQWSGQAGFHYYETRQVRVNGKMQTQRVQKTRWEHRSGSLRHFFDDVLVVASKELNQEDITRIFPYKLDEVVNYDPKLMLGWEGEIYSVEVDEGYQKADSIMDKRLYHLCAYELGGDTHRNLRVSTSKYLRTFKHIILPLWISSYQYKGKTYHFTINGQTGKIGGKKPISALRVAIAVILGIIVLIALVLLMQVLQGDS